MRSTYKAIDIIYEMLIDAQNPANGLPFVMSAGTNIYDYQPGDSAVDGQPTEEGIYIFFDRTVFDTSVGSEDEQEHGPRMNIDLYASVGSTQSAGSGDVNYSVRRADRSIRSMAIEVYEAISHKSFRRLFNERLVADGVTNWQLYEINIQSVAKTGVLRLKNSKHTIAHQRIVCVPRVTEIHTSAVGSPYTGSDDLITPYRRESDL
jgi:hypothetical protein